MVAWLLAQQDALAAPRKGVNPIEVVGPMMTLAGVLALMAIVLAIAAVRYRKARQEEEEPIDLMSDFHDLKRQGELSPEEFEKVKSILQRKLKGNIDGSPKFNGPPRFPGDEAT